MTRNNDLEQRIAALADITSEDIADLSPKTTREYLMVLWPTQKRILEHLEEMNGFKEEAIDRIGRLETERKVVYSLVFFSIVSLAIKILLG